MVKHTKVRTGDVYSPFGNIVAGFEVIIDDGLPMPKLIYTRERIAEILNAPNIKVSQISNTHLVVESQGI